MNSAVQSPAPTDAAEARGQRIAARHEQLMATDPQYRAAAPLESVGNAKKDPSRRMAQIMALAMETYADRPALGRRSARVATDPATGRASLQLLDGFETFTYREVWSDVRGLARLWQHADAVRVQPGDRVCILGFAGVGYVTVDFAAIHVGAVSVPLQTNAPTAQLAAIIAETEPRCLATSIEHLEMAVDIVLSTHAPASLLVFDYCTEDDAQRELFERATQRLATSSESTQLLTLEAACERGRELPGATLFVPAAGDDPLATIYYTSGSTGSPKGAMYGERMSGIVWRAPDTMPLISLNFMPMNHSFGRSLIARTLAAGGICYFAAKSDLSTLFDDVQSVRPTQLNLVPRICDMIYQRYQGELTARGPNADADEAMADFRERLLGGRLLACAFGSAPMTAELHAFIQQCLDATIVNNYGATEVLGVTSNNRIVRPIVIDWKLIDVPELGYFGSDQPHPRGELLVKTHTLMQGYFKKPEATAAVFDEDGFYKTGDVMAQIGPDELIYVDRRNNVQKLAQGEFVAIAQLEAAFTAGHPVVHQVYLYGTSDRAFLLAVIVPDAEALEQSGVSLADEPAVKALLREAIQQVAHAEELNAYEVPRDFIVEPEPFTVANGLLTGIGKHKRPELKARYGARLEAMYDEIAAKQAHELHDLRSGGRDAPVLETVTRAVQATLGIEGLEPGEPVSFKDIGGDSLSALSLSMLLEEIYDVEVPVGVITHPSGSLRQLTTFIEEARKTGGERPTFASVHGRDASEARASDLTLDRFIDDATLERAASLPPASSAPPRTVLLTGANGYLGRFLCLEWLERLAGSGGRLVCIVRGRDAADARRRIEEVFDSGDETLMRHFAALAEKHLEVHAGDLAERHLGLDHDTWTRLAESVDVIVHPAALVNHVLPYSQLFGPNVVGTAELIRLALTERLKRFVNVSTVAVAHGPDGKCIDEDADVRTAVPARSLQAGSYASGYATSKWAAEVLLRDANARFGLPVSTFRSDMILAHGRYRGQLNVPDMFTRWIYSVVKTGLAPRSFYRAPADGRPVRAHYDGLPVDFTAASIVALGEHAKGGYHTYHVLNPHDDGISMDQFVEWMTEAGHPIQRLDDYADWVERFETALKGLPEKQRQQSFLPLLHQLRHPMPATGGAIVSARRFREAVQSLQIGPERDIPHISRELIEKYLTDLKLVGLL